MCRNCGREEQRVNSMIERRNQEMDEKIDLAQWHFITDIRLFREMKPESVSQKAFL